MSLFTTYRERRLWLWTFAIVVAIYSTLGLTGTLAGFLRKHGLMEASFIFGAFLIVATIVAQGLKARPGGTEIAVALGIAAAYLMVFVRMSITEERTHLIEYGLVGAFIHEALTERASQDRHVPMPALLAILATTLVGVLDECIQAFLPSRVFDPFDILFNFLAGTMAVVARLAMAPVQRPGWRVWFLWLMAAAYGWGTAVEVTRLGELSLQSSPPRILAAYWGVTAAGILVGVLQWLVLRKKVARSGWWVLTSFGAAAVFGILVFGIGTVNADVGWIAGTGLFGTVAGVLQWLVLKRQIQGAGWWVLASTVGWIVGIPVGEMVGWNGLGAAYGAVTGTALVWLLRQPALEQDIRATRFITQIPQ